MDFSYLYTGTKLAASSKKADFPDDFFSFSCSNPTKPPHFQKGRFYFAMSTWGLVWDVCSLKQRSTTQLPGPGFYWTDLSLWYQAPAVGLPLSHMCQWSRHGGLSGSGHLFRAVNLSFVYLPPCCRDIQTQCVGLSGGLVNSLHTHTSWRAHGLRRYCK